MEAVPVDLHIAVFAFPFGTHAAPLLSLVKGIAAAAPKATFSLFSTAKSNASLISQINRDDLRNIALCNVQDGLPKGYVPSGNPIESLNLFLKATPGNYRRAVEERVAKTGKKITCFVTDALFWFGAEMAEEMHVKWVPLWTGGPQSLIIHVVTDVIRQRMRINDVSEDQILNFIPGFSAIKFADLPPEVVGDVEAPFATLLYKMGVMLPQATAVAVNSFDAINPLIVNELKSRFQMLLNVGPFPLTVPQPVVPDEHGCLDWLDKHAFASVAYISFGSVITPPPHELTALAEALEECSFPFIWSFRGNRDEQLPKGFLERTRTKGKVLPWVPQMQILQHASVGVFVTHSGWNSILESIIGGVPMICRPFFGDQQVNTRMLETVWGIGLGVENGIFTKSETKKALKSILSSEEGKLMRQNIAALSESAMKAVQPDGNSARDVDALKELILSTNASLSEVKKFGQFKQDITDSIQILYKKKIYLGEISSHKTYFKKTGLFMQNGGYS